MMNVQILIVETNEVLQLPVQGSSPIVGLNAETNQDQVIGERFELGRRKDNAFSDGFLIQIDRFFSGTVRGWYKTALSGRDSSRCFPVSITLSIQN